MNKKVKEYLKSYLRQQVIEEGTPLLDFNKKKNWLVVSLFCLVFVTSAASMNNASKLYEYMTIGR